MNAVGMPFDVAWRFAVALSVLAVPCFIAAGSRMRHAWAVGGVGIGLVFAALVIVIGATP